MNCAGRPRVPDRIGMANGEWRTRPVDEGAEFSVLFCFYFPSNGDDILT